MCGIAGVWSNRLRADDLAGRVTHMAEALRHRGPDDAGVEVVSRSTSDAEARVVFGHRRLSILDLSAAGHQPMQEPLTGNWITYNGEIYNFRELRAQLEGRGHVFASRCDTEVILKAYSEWGVGCWRRLRGIFAFGLWDAQYRELHLVRDHLGIKPLYFAKTSRGVAFASEVRAMLAGDWVERRLDREALRSYLKYGSVQEPCTLVAGIESLAPGHYLTLDMSGIATVRHYWRVTEALIRNWERPPTGEGVLSRLEDSVGRQLVADVPVGVFLSGGVDSTAVAALAARAQPGNVRTFCIGSEEKEFDESEEAARSARYLGCQHATLVLEGQTVKAHLEAALASYDQPSSDGINTYFISMLVRQAGMKVALSGLGGDELFVGYSGFRKGLLFERAGRLLHMMPAEARHQLSRSVAALSAPGDPVLGALAEITEHGLAAPYFASRTVFSRAHMTRLLTANRRDDAISPWEAREGVLAVQARGLAEVDRVSFFELHSYMLSTLLRDSDQMSMAHGLELRVPLIDPEVVEYVLPIAAAEKTAGGTSKRVLLDAVNDLIPAEVVTRRKRGFTLPFEQWLLRDLESEVSSCFASAPRGPWQQAVFRDVWVNFRRGRVAWSRVLTLFVLENWLEKNRVMA